MLVSSCVALVLSVGGIAARAQVSILTQHNDNFRDGVNAGETILTPANVNVNQFGKLFKVTVDDQVFAQPLIVNQVSIAGGIHNAMYVATANNSVYAFDADNGTLYWHVNFGPPISKETANWNCNDTLGSAGIMSTPVINNGTLFVVAQTYQNSTSIHMLHSLDISTHAEGPGSPVQVQTPGFSSVSAVQRSALLSANGNVYFSFASHCDQGSWKGLTFAYNQANLAQIGMFNASPSDNGNGIWQSGNGAAADPSGNIYWVTGNGGWDGVNNFGESMLKGSPNLTLEDWHTPSNWHDLDSLDSDLTASGPMLLMNTDFLIAGGKDGYLRLVNTTDMGHLGDSNAENWSVTSSHIHSLNYFNSNLYVWGQNDYLQVFKFNGSTFGTTPTFRGSLRAMGHPGATLSISANGSSNGILWASTNTQGDAWHATEPGILYAYNLANMSQIWTSEMNAARDDCNNYAKFTPPTIANGKVYLASFGTQSTHSGQVCVYGELSGGTPSAVGSTLIPNGTYIVKSANDGQALDDPAFSTMSGTGIEQYPVNNYSNQKWTVTNLGSNVITLTNVASGQALEVRGGSSSPSALVDQSLNQGGLWQQWTVDSVSGNIVRLTNRASGEALDVSGASKAAQAPIDQYPYHANAWQMWQFAPIN